MPAVFVSGWDFKKKGNMHYRKYAVVWTPIQTSSETLEQFEERKKSFREFCEKKYRAIGKHPNLYIVEASCGPKEVCKEIYQRANEEGRLTMREDEVSIFEIRGYNYGIPWL